MSTQRSIKIQLLPSIGSSEDSPGIGETCGMMIQQSGSRHLEVGHIET